MRFGSCMKNCSELCPWPLSPVYVPVASKAMFLFSPFLALLPPSTSPFFPSSLPCPSFLPFSPKGVLLPYSIFPCHNPTPTDTATGTSSCLVPLLSPHKAQLHPLHRLNPQDVESFRHDGGSGFAEQQPPHVHLHDLTCRTMQELEQLLRTTDTTFPRGIPSTHSLDLGLGTPSPFSRSLALNLPAHRQVRTQAVPAPFILPHEPHLLCSSISATTVFPAEGNTLQIACPVECDTGTCSSPRPALTTLPVLLNTVAVVVELSEGGGQLIKVVTECVQQQVLQNLLQDLREPEDALAQLPLLLMVEDEHLLLGCLLQHLLVDIGQASNSPETIQNTVCW